VIRRARPREAPLLSALALRSKAHWGYDDAFMRACTDELTLSSDEVRNAPVWLLERDDRVLGFYGLGRRSADEAELEYLFVEPDAIGSGVGGRLLRHAREQARSLGFRTLRIEGDPNAEPFYLAMGARPIGRAPSASIPGRTLPLFLLAL
jgi:GNAT superfamily N-acetyltransferase